MNSWATKHYITPSTVDDISTPLGTNESKLDVLNTILYQASNDNWLTVINSSIENGVHVVSGLLSNSVYELRSVYNGIYSKNTQVITTEANIQLPNSDFEEWTSSTKYTQPFYEPWNSEGMEQCWDTNNNETMTQKYSTYINYKCFPTTCFTSDCYSGSKAVQIRAVATNGANSEIMGAGSKKGRLFVGNYNNEGRSCSSRPSSISFWYKYDSYDNEVGYAEFSIYSETNKIVKGNIDLSSVSTYSNSSFIIAFKTCLLRCTKLT